MDQLIYLGGLLRARVGATSGAADRRYPIADAGRTAEKLAEKSADRWSIVVALLVAPKRESRRLAALLEQLPTERRRHEIADDVQRRPGAGRRSLEGTDRTPGALASFVNPVVLD